MTMAKVENETVTQVGIPDELRSLGVRQLKNKGWYKVVDSAGKPTTETDPGYHWVYGAEWSVEDGHVVGVWQVAQRPQPYPVGHLLKAKVGLLLLPSLTMTKITTGTKILNHGLKRP